MPRRHRGEDLHNADYIGPCGRAWNIAGTRNNPDYPAELAVLKCLDGELIPDERDRANWQKFFQAPESFHKS